MKLFVLCFNHCYLLTIKHPGQYLIFYNMIFLKKLCKRQLPCLNKKMVIAITLKVQEQIRNIKQCNIMTQSTYSIFMYWKVQFFY